MGSLNSRLWEELRSYGVNVWSLESPSPQWGEGRGEGVLAIPAASGIALPLAEIIPVQLMSLYLSCKAGYTPGTFRHIGKVTTIE